MTDTDTTQETEFLGVTDQEPEHPITEVLPGDPFVDTQEPRKGPNQNHVIAGLVVLALVFGISFAIEQYTLVRAQIESVQTASAVQALSVATTTEDAPEPVPVDPFADIAITAKAAYVWDVSAQRALYNKNAGIQLPLASVTKLMTAAAAADLIPEKDTLLPVTLASILRDGESGFHDGEQWTFQNLLDYTLVTSSNDGAHAIALHAGASQSTQNPLAGFIAYMNALAAEIGLAQTYFINPSGLDSNQVTSGSYGSARDMAFLMEYIIEEHPGLLDATRELAVERSNEAGLIYTGYNTNAEVDQIPGIIGSKTGFTTLAGGNLVVAFDAGLNHPIVVSVLGSTREERFSDVRMLIETAIKAQEQ